MIAKLPQMIAAEGLVCVVSGIRAVSAAARSATTEASPRSTATKTCASEFANRS
jgi:hypothetical protein